MYSARPLLHVDFSSKNSNELVQRNLEKKRITVTAMNRQVGHKYNVFTINTFTRGVAMLKYQCIFIQELESVSRLILSPQNSATTFPSVKLPVTVLPIIVQGLQKWETGRKLTWIFLLIQTVDGWRCNFITSLISQNGPHLGYETSLIHTRTHVH